MTKDLKETFYEKQFPMLLSQMDRIAKALERQVELLEESQAMQTERLEEKKTLQEGQQAARREKFAANLQKLAEVDQMARELRRKLEEKQAATRAAAAEKATPPAEGSDSSDEIDPSTDPSVSTEN